MDTVPHNLIYGVDDKPPWGTTLLLACQHLIVVVSYSIFAVLVARQIGATAEQVEVITTMALLASAVGVFFQSLKRGPIGSGYLAAHVSSIIYIPASIAAGNAGGLALISGMTLIAGLFEAFLSQVMRFLRRILTPSVTGVIVTMVGFSLVKDAVTKFVGLGIHDHVVQGTEVLVSTTTLVALLVFSIWGSGRIRLFGFLISVAGGYLAAFALGLMAQMDVERILMAPFLALPKLDHYGWSFDLRFLPAFLVAAVAAAVKASGMVVTSQRINDPKWRHPDMRNAGKGVLADAAGTFSAGLLGSIGTNVSPTSVGLTVATGATSRVIGMVMAWMLIAITCCPKLIGIVSFLPDPVMGGVLIYAVCIISGYGLQLALSRTMDMRRTFLIGLSLLAGLSVEVAPKLYQQMPAWSKVFFDSPITVCAIVAVSLSLLFRIGISRHAKLVLSSGPGAMDEAHQFLKRVAVDWRLTREVLTRASGAMTGWVNSQAAQSLSGGSTEVEVTFDEIELAIHIRCPLEESVDRKETPTEKESAHPLFPLDQTCTSLFSSYADHVKTHLEDGFFCMTLFFDA